MTRKQMRDYLRSLSSELDNKAVMNGEIDLWIDLAQQKVANDLVGKGIGIKSLIKQATPTFTVQAITSAAVTSKVATLTATAHGYVVGDVVIVQDLGTVFDACNGVWEITAKDTDTFSFVIDESDIAGAGQTAGWVTNGYCTAESDMMDIPKPIVDLQAKFTTTAALGGEYADYRKVTEKLPPDFEDMNPYSAHNNTYEVATITEPVYCIDGNATPARIIRVYPANVDVAILKYYMRPAALASDSTALSIPDEYRDLVLMDIKSKMDFKLKGFEASQVNAVNYQKKLQELLGNYQTKMQATQAERMSLSND